MLTSGLVDASTGRVFTKATTSESDCSCSTYNPRSGARTVRVKAGRQATYLVEPLERRLESVLRVQLVAHHLQSRSQQFSRYGKRDAMVWRSTGGGLRTAQASQLGHQCALSILCLLEPAHTMHDHSALRHETGDGDGAPRYLSLHRCTDGKVSKKFLQCDRDGSVPLVANAATN